MREFNRSDADGLDPHLAGRHDSIDGHVVDTVDVADEQQVAFADTVIGEDLLAETNHCLRLGMSVEIGQSRREHALRVA
ncbi:hypothetical protein SDC9_170698 [bioreactor metagenome]|uniref:Uncharacterized protein n=1 Tax=bioreactor metagenome TaxID=1076179 RepID=A0A645GB94_9ZZZZ